MVARALSPGCTARYVVILEGDESIGKSKLVLDLGAPWSQVFDHTMDSKEAHIAVQGCWVAELAELDSLSCIGQQFFGHIRPENYAASASRQHCSCLT